MAMTEQVDDLFSFGTWVRRRRKALNLTQAAFADRVGCAEVTIRKLEGEVFRPSREMAERLADCLDIPSYERAVFLQAARGERSVDRLPTPTAQLDLAPRSPIQGQQPGALIPIATVPHPAPLPPGSRMPLSRNPLFVGREADLRQLATVLQAGGTAAIGQGAIAAATGLGGIGKTQLACEFVHRYGQYFAGGVFWLSFADPAAVPAEVAACGDVDGMQLSAAFGTLPLDEQIRRVLTALTSPIPRLLVFDTCEDEALLDHWRPKHGGCHVLITSRRHHWDPALGVQPVPLDVLPRSESTALLGRFRPDVSTDDADLHAIAAELGDLPLALHLAGSFLAKYRHVMTPAQYRVRLCTPTILDDRSLQAAGLSPTRHMQHVARTFEQSYAQLDPADPSDALARTLLAHAAYFAPGESLPHWLLLQTLHLPDDDAERALLIEDALTRLIDLGLLNTDTMGSLRLHRLLATFVRTVLGDQAIQGEVEATMLRVADDLNARRNPRRLLTIQPHLRSIVEAAQSHADARTAALSKALGYHLWLLGVYPEAQSCHEYALAIYQRVFGLDHPDTAKSLSNLGIVLTEQGQYTAAQDCFEQALVICQRVLGADHPDTVQSLNNLGNVLEEQGQYAAAQCCHEQALAIRQQVLGADHPDTARSFNNLGNVLEKQGQYATAQGYMEQGLAIRQRVLGADHADTAGNLHSLGVVLAHAGQYEQAQGYFEQALAICERVLGAEHPEMARSLRSLGELVHKHGDRAQARRYLEQALIIFEQRLGPHHPDTEQTRRMFATLNATCNVNNSES